MITLADRLPIGVLMRTFWVRITLTWGLTLAETAMFALLPLLNGRSIDDDRGSFTQLMTVLGALKKASEEQVHTLDGRDPKALAKHFLGLRLEEVPLSDSENLVHGLV